MKAFAIAGVLLTVSSSLVAQEQVEVTGQEVQNTNRMDDGLRNVYRALNGQEIEVDGAIGSLFGGDQLYFADGTGRYETDLDAGRDVRRQIEGCELKLMNPETSPCKVVGMAEASTDDDDENIGDGLEIRLILYRVDTFENGGG